MDFDKSPTPYRPRQLLSNKRSIDLINKSIIEYLQSPLREANLTFGNLCKVEGFSHLANPSIKTKARNRFHYLEKNYIATPPPYNSPLFSTDKAVEANQLPSPELKQTPSLLKPPLSSSKDKSSSPFIIKTLIEEFEDLSFAENKKMSLEKYNSKQQLQVSRLSL